MSTGMRVIIIGSMVSAVVCPVTAAVPDRPILTEVFINPPGADGPTGHSPNLNQEFIEIYLPTAAQLAPGLNADALRLAFFEIEGDSGNTQRGHVNQRFDLPTFDLNPANGTTAGAKPRPSSGVVVLSWVDYLPGNPPAGLLGTPGTRVALIQGGITSSPAGTLVIAMNGAEFNGTTNFAVPVAESLIDVPNENADGVCNNGSVVYLLVDRDDPGYAELEDREHPELGPSNASLPTGTVLGLSALLDGIAGNDDLAFDVTQQPYVSPTGQNIDLEDVLPQGGVFSQCVAQIDDSAGAGYMRRFVDELRTTEDGVPGNENPAADAQNGYRAIFNSGPFFPTPGSVVFTTSAPKLSVAESARHDFLVLAGTTGRPGMICANAGGNFGINVSVAAGMSSNPAQVTFGSAPGETGVSGQTEAFPQISAAVPAGATNGAIATAQLVFTAVNSHLGDPAVINPVQVSTAQATVLKPTTGVDQLGSPLGTTVFPAVQGLGADPGVVNELAGSDFADFVSANLNTLARGTLGNLNVLLDPATDLEDIVVVDPLRQTMPVFETDFINAPGAPGTDDLVTTVLTSAKVLSGSTVYNASISSDQSGIRAIELDIPETATSGGTFATDGMLFFAEPNGNVGAPRTGLSSVTTGRTFELALIDSNVTFTGIESGDDDDMGLIVEVGRVHPGAQVVPGQFVFLSFSGGLEGEDIDTLDVPGVNATVFILLDLDNLDTVLGAETITRLFVVDANTGGTVNIMEAVSLNQTCNVDVDCDDQDACNGTEMCIANSCVLGVSMDCDDNNVCTFDGCAASACNNGPRLYADTNNDGTVDLLDILCVLDGFGGVFNNCTLSNVDLVPCPAGNGFVDLTDLMAVLDAFRGVNQCTCTPP